MLLLETFSLTRYVHSVQLCYMARHKCYRLLFACPICGGDIRTTRPDKKTCSTKCRVAYHRAHKAGARSGERVFRLRVERP